MPYDAVLGCSREARMNSFYEHIGTEHWRIRCFRPRILLNGVIRFQQPERVVGFFNTYRQL